MNRERLQSPRLATKRFGCCWKECVGRIDVKKRFHFQSLWILFLCESKEEGKKVNLYDALDSYLWTAPPKYLYPKNCTNTAVDKKATKKRTVFFLQRREMADTLEALGRKELQALCKQHGIKANGKVPMIFANSTQSV